MAFHMNNWKKSVFRWEKYYSWWKTKLFMVKKVQAAFVMNNTVVHQWVVLLSSIVHQHLLLYWLHDEQCCTNFPSHVWFRWPFEAGDKYLPIYGAFSGLICNSFYRRMLMIRTGQILSAASMATLPALSVKIGWLAFVTTPILAGDLQCAICGEMRGALVNVSCGKVWSSSYNQMTAFGFYKTDG